MYGMNICSVKNVIGKFIKVLISMGKYWEDMFGIILFATFSYKHINIFGFFLDGQPKLRRCSLGGQCG